jgi:hypothetical protein
LFVVVSRQTKNAPSLGVLCASAVKKLSNNRRDAESAENFPFAQSGDGDWAKTTGDKAMRGRAPRNTLSLHFWMGNRGEYSL